MNILLIGGTGNISSAFAALLDEHGHEVSVLTRGRNVAPERYRRITADRRDPSAMRAALRGEQPDVVVNFLGYSLSDIEIDFELFSGKTSQYIFISTAMVYAKPHRRVPLTEDSPRGNPFSEYARNKEKCETRLLEMREQTGFPVTIVRPSHTYSESWIPNPVTSAGYTVPARMEQGKPLFVHGDGESLWTLTWAADFAVGLAGLAGNKKAIGEAFHITSDEALTWNRIYAEIAGAIGVERPEILKIPTDFICEHCPEMIAKLKGDKAEPGVFDNSKIKRFVPEFTAKTSFHDGIRQCIRWFQAGPARRVIDPKIDAIFNNVISAWNAKERGICGSDQVCTVRETAGASYR